MSRLIKIYTDGSSIGNPGPGGYGIVMLIDKEDYKKEFSQGFKLTTNNRMELMATIKALKEMNFKFLMQWSKSSLQFLVQDGFYTHFCLVSGAGVNILQIAGAIAPEEFLKNSRFL